MKRVTGATLVHLRECFKGRITPLAMTILWLDGWAPMSQRGDMGARDARSLRDGKDQATVG